MQAFAFFTGKRVCSLCGISCHDVTQECKRLHQVCGEYQALLWDDHRLEVRDEADATLKCLRA